MDEKLIKELHKLGFHRMTRFNEDRLYISATKLGLTCEFYKRTGNIAHSEFRGVKISNRQARRLKKERTYILVETGEVFGTNERFIKLAKKLKAKAERRLERRAERRAEKRAEAAKKEEK